MRYHLHMYSTLKDEKILKIVRNLGLKTCLCRSICPPVYLKIAEIDSGICSILPQNVSILRFLLAGIFECLRFQYVVWCVF